ncbi:MAG: hypothetical protein R3B95_19305 [Nitrospirales bacterium]|nr:hypothetical protein [Nitrospirales bacterium]
MSTRREQVLYAVACDCQKCREESGQDFEILGFLYGSPAEAKGDLKKYEYIGHSSCFIVEERTKPFEPNTKAQRPQKPRRRKAA